MASYFQKRIDAAQRELAENEALFLVREEDLRYYCNFSGDSSFLYIDQERLIFLTDGRYIEQIKNESKLKLDIRELTRQNRLVSQLKDILKTAPVKTLFVRKDDLRLDLYERLTPILEDNSVKLEDNQITLRQRMVKNETEIETIRANLQLTELAYQTILPLIREGRSEKEIAAEIEYGLKKQGADRMSFETIVASGPRSALPHGVASDKKIQKNELVMFDFGIFRNGYASDFTRCYYFAKIIGGKIKEIHSVVREAVIAAEETIRPGIPASLPHEAAMSVIQKAGYGEYFVHSTGHGVGLEIHEFPRIGEDDSTVLREGMVFTIEPGIYIPGLGGIRLEDMVTVRKNGAEILTTTDYDL